MAQVVNPDRLRKIAENLHHYGEDPDGHRGAEIAMYSEYLGLDYRKVLAFIAKTDASLG